MRWSRVVFVFLLAYSFSYANHISWLGEYDKALSLAKEKRKPLMVLLVKKSCKKCNEVIERNFINHSYIDDMRQKYVSVIITYEGRCSYPIELFYSNTFPTLFFVNSIDESFLFEPIYAKDIDIFLKHNFF